MVNRPPYDRDPPPPPGGFDPRFTGGRGPDPRGGGDPRSRDPRDTYPGGADPRDPYPRDTDPFDPRERGAPVRRGMARSTMVLIGIGLLLLLGVIAFALSLSRSGPGSDRLDGNESGAANETTAANAPEERCAASATYDKIKRELFRQAAATRGSDLTAFDRLSTYAALRVSNPVLKEEDEGLERVSCTGAVALDLPPGVQVVGGRRTLSANLGYSLQPSADGSGDVVALTGAEPITAPLATLARVAEAGTAAPQQPTDGAPLPPVAPSAPTAPDQPQPAPPPPVAAPAPAPSPAPLASVRPSFNCANARTRGEVAVCRSPELASLDRQMANFFVSARRGADPGTRATLERTRSRFLSYRDTCRNDACIADAYRGRISEIRDIVDGRWRGE